MSYILLALLSAAAYANVTKNVDLSKLCEPVDVDSINGQGKKDGTVKVRDPRLRVWGEFKQKGEDARLDRIMELRTSRNLRLTRQQWIQSYLNSQKERKQQIAALESEIKSIKPVEADVRSAKREELKELREYLAWTEMLLKERGLESKWYEYNVATLAEDGKKRGLPFRSGIKVVKNGDKIELWRVATDGVEDIDGSKFKNLTSRPSFTIAANQLPPGFLETLSTGKYKSTDRKGKETVKDLSETAQFSQSVQMINGKEVEIKPEDREVDGTDVFTTSDGSLVLSYREPAQVIPFREFGSFLNVRCPEENTVRPEAPAATDQ